MADNREQILHYQRRLLKERKPDKVLHILQRLKQCPMTLELLQETGIGKTVNKVRKLDGEAGEKARSLIKEWKLLIAAKGAAKINSSNREESISLAKKNPSWDGHYNSKTGGSRSITIEREDSYTVVERDTNNDDSDDDGHGHDDIDDYMSQTSEERQRNTLQHLYSSGYDAKPHGTNETGRDKKMPDKMQSPDNHRKLKTEQHKQNAHLRKDQKSGSEKHADPNGLTGGGRKKRLQSAEGFDSTTFSFEQCLGLNDRKSSKKKRTAMVQPKSSPEESEEVNRHVASTGKVRKARENKKDKSSPADDIDKLPGPLSSTEWKSTAPLKLSWNDVDVDSTLPSIQPNYRPLRLGIPDSPPRKKKAAFELDSTAFTSSKHTRTQVFSGRRNMLTEVPRLYDMCIRVLQDNVRSLNFLEGVPYDILEPVLKLCNSKQLYNLEDLNPYLLDDTDELWRILAQRQYKSQVPDEMETWREMFLRLDDEREKKLKSTTANIKVTMAKADPVRKTLLADIAKPPRNVARKQAKFGTGQSQASQSVAAAKRDSANPIAAKVALGLTRHVPASSSSNEVSASTQPAKVVKKIAPLMQKTLKLMKNIRR